MSATSTSTSAQQTGEILFYITCALCILITILITVFAWRFNKYQNTIVVRKRYPNIVKAILVLLTINIFIRIPLNVMLITPSTLPLFAFMHRSNLIIGIEAFLNVYLTDGAVTLIALRIWMIFYKLNYTYSSSTSAWKTILNPLLATNNWFISNKAKYGNATVMFYRYFLPFYLIYATLDFLLLLNYKWSLLFAFNLSYYQLISGLYFCALMIFCVYLYHRTPNWNDHCFIRAEMRLASFIWLICLTFYVIDGIVFFALTLFNTAFARNHSDYAQSIIATYIALAFFTVYALLLTWYPTHKMIKLGLKPSQLQRASSPEQVEMVLNNKRQRARSIDHSNNGTHSNETRPMRALSEPSNGRGRNRTSNKSPSDDNEFMQHEPDSQNTDDLNTILSDILSDAQLFDLFMAHLSRSFTSESLLSFVEFYQFKQYIILQFQHQILNEDNKLFVERLKIKMQSKRTKHSKQFIKKLRYKQQHAANASNEAVTHNVLLPDSVPKSYLVFGDFMVVSLINGTSLKKSMGKLEKSASMFGRKLHEQHEKQQKLSQAHAQNKQHEQDQEQLATPSMQLDGRSKSKSKSKSNVSGDKSEESDHDKSEKSKSDRDRLDPTWKNQSSNSKRKSQTRPRINSNKHKHGTANTLRKESATAFSTTGDTFYAGSFVSVRLQIPESAYVRETDGIHASMESVTEKDIYDHDDHDMNYKVGTPSIVSQTIPNDITTLDISGDEHEHEHEHENVPEDPEESQTTTQTTTYLHHGHKHGGVSVEVDEHLDKNREISVTPQPSIVASVSALPNSTYPFARNVSDTKTRRNKKHRQTARPRIGSNTMTSRSEVAVMTPQLSVTADGLEDKYTPRTRKQTTSDTDMIKLRQTDSDDLKEKSPTPPNNRVVQFANVRGKVSEPQTPSVTLKGIGFGDMPSDMEEAKKKTRIIAHKLYMKYLHIGAECEINIPHRVRKKLMKSKIDDIDAWVNNTSPSMIELYKMFDECMEEMFALMRSMVGGFIETASYRNIVAKF